jgi:hypothetical protein
MRSHMLATLLIAATLVSQPAAPLAPAHRLVDGNDWQKASMQERRAYLVGVSNVISVGARYDTKKGSTDTFAVNAQKGLAGTEFESGLAAIDAWYKANPGDLDKPVLSVIWRELAKRQPVG